MEIKVENGLVGYDEAVSEMERRVADIRAGTADEQLWFLEHPPLYTAGTSAKDSDLINPRFPVHQTGRGGQYTYHGPGQRVVYVMMDLKKRQSQPDIKRFVWQLEEWVIRTLAEFGVKGERREGRVGIWVPLSLDPSPLGGEGKRSEAEQGEGALFKEAKIAAIGVRVRHWVTFHGISVNVDPDLSHYDGIVPCGINEYGVTSLKALGVNAGIKDVDAALQRFWGKVFETMDQAA